MVPYLVPVLTITVQVPVTVMRIPIQDPRSGAFLTPVSGMGKKSGSGIRKRLKKSGSGSGINNPDLISESLETIFWVKIPVLN
jgi:hypothetical protein